MKQEYSGQLNVIFDANIAETNTFKITANEERARSSADKAEGVLARIKEPTGEQQLQLTAAFVDTGQNGTDVAEELLKQSVIVKPWKQPGFDRFIRVSVGLPEENDQFLNAFAAILGLEPSLLP